MHLYGFVQITDDGITAIVEEDREELEDNFSYIARNAPMPPPNRLSIIVQNWK